MRQLVEAIGEAKRAGDPRRLLEAIPYARFLGMSLELDGEDPGAVVGKMAFSEALIGDPTVPALHGGTLGALLESTAIFQLLWSAETAVVPKTINITVEYLRPGQQRDTFARGTLTKLGRRVANVRVQAWQASREQPIAIGVAHFLIPPAGPSPKQR